MSYESWLYFITYFMKIVVMNLKNCFDDHVGSVIVSNNCATLVKNEDPIFPKVFSRQWRTSK